MAGRNQEMTPILILLASLASFVYSSVRINELEERLAPTTGQIATDLENTIYRLYSVVEANDEEPTFIGTGFAVKFDGKNYLATAGHVCDADVIKLGYAVEGNMKATPKAKFKVYRLHDICIVDKLDNKLPALTLASDENRRQKYYAVGFPNGYPLVATEGNLLGIENMSIPADHIPAERCTKPRYLHVLASEGEGMLPLSACLFYGPLIKTSIPVTYGSSGSPVVNEEHEVVGVVSVVDQEAAGNWAGVVPLEEVRNFLKELSK
jgi:S1-C subfamily serine protease